ncbi:hypothetical protein [Actinokineospora sp.]|uniref:hypothetical protein n=1 Tax=Actinokineospora sp. TaxID=1872133 RepID=UPI003D6BF733
MPDQPWPQAGAGSVRLASHGAHSSLGAQGYTAFGVFAVSQVDTNAVFSRLKRDGMVVASLGSCPRETTNKADFCLATDVEVAA